MKNKTRLTNGSGTRKATAQGASHSRGGWGGGGCAIQQNPVSHMYTKKMCPSTNYAPNPHFLLHTPPPPPPPPPPPTQCYLGYAHACFLLWKTPPY